MLRIYAMPLLIAVSFGWALYEWLFKKNSKKAEEIFSITVFCSVIWGLILYWLFT